MYYYSSILVVVLGLSLFSGGVSGDNAHDVLVHFGFPPGLLQNNVESYSLAGDGNFTAELRSECYVKFTDLVHYESHIAGKLAHGSFTDVSGIHMKKFFAWFTITDVVADVDDRTVEFRVGFVSEKFPFSLFQTIRSCTSNNKSNPST